MIFIIPIILSAQTNTDLLIRFLAGRLKQSTRVSYLLVKEAELQPDSEILLISAELLPQWTLAHAIVVLCDPCAASEIQLDSGQVICIRSSGAVGIGKIPQNLQISDNVEILTCGMQDSNSVCFSSLEEDEAIICLMHTIRNLSGKMVEPGEIMIHKDADINPYHLLCLAALSFLL